MNDWKAILRFLGILLIAEGAMMLSCLIPAVHFNDGTILPIAASGGFTLSIGGLLLWRYHKYRLFANKKMAFLLVCLMWLVLSLFGTLPFLSTGATTRFSNAFFETMSGFTSTGATIFSDIEHLPSSVLLWRSMSQWIGGFGIILLVLAIAPSLGINKYSLYTAEASGADNTGKTATTMSSTIRRMLAIYILLTSIFIIALLASGLQFWDSVNLTFTNISSGGFSIYNDSAASLSHGQQYIIALAMLLSGVNFALLFNIFTFRFRLVRRKLDQFGFYIGLTFIAILFVALALHSKMDYGWEEALRCSTVQTISVITTSGTLVADTSLWWTPIVFLFVILSLCGGMAGSTTGGLKVMRVLILLRNVRNILRNRLHPSAINPVRLNGYPVSQSIITNVMVIFFVYLFTILAGILALMLCGIDSTQSIGAVIASITGYGPGLGASGGFGCYASFTPVAKYLCAFLMLLGRLECLSVFILFSPKFWR